MNLVLTPELVATAARCLWFEPPGRAISDPTRFAAYVLTHGAHRDVKALREQMDDEDLRRALEAAPPGIFDARSWAYWNLMLFDDPTRSMPQRRFG